MFAKSKNKFNNSTIMRSSTLLCFATLFLSYSNAANILGIFHLPVKSHNVIFETLLKRLAEKGHNVDVVTPFVSKEVPPRYNQLSLAGMLPDTKNNMPMSLVSTFSYYNIIEFMIRFAGVDMCEIALKTPVLQNLKKSDKKYDLVITEIFGSDCMLGFGHLFQAPTVSMMSSVSLPWANDRIGNPDNPSYIPNYFMPATNSMSLFERMENTLKLVAAKILYYFRSSRDSNKLSREFFGPDVPDLQDLILNTSLVLANSHFSIFQSRPIVPNFIEVGGIHIRDPKPLPKYFEDILKTESKGIIFLSMGSMVLTETFDVKKLQDMFDAFAMLPYKVLWKANRQKFPEGLNIPANIHFEEWVPQFDILCHPNVKLFVSHGGLLGVQEAIYCGVPRIGIPLFADQVHNIRWSEKLGLAIQVSYQDINKQKILEVSRKLLENPSYKENCARVSRQFKDRPMSPLDTAVYWVEYVIRHRGAPHLRSAGANLLWYQYFLLDLIGVAAFGVFLFVYGIVIVMKFKHSLVSGSRKTKSE